MLARARPVTESAIEQIKAMIVAGELAPGMQLPPEQDLAHRLGVSRGSLREAVRGLSLVGVLDVRQGAGTYVTSLEAEVLLKATKFAIDIHRDDSVMYILQLRRILEPTAAALASVRMTAAELATLDRHLDEMPTDQSVEAQVTSDLKFHQIITQASGNPFLSSFLDSISGPIHRVRRWRARTEACSVERTTAEHRTIVRALRSRSPEAASAASMSHVFAMEQWLREAIESGVPIPAREQNR